MTPCTVGDAGTVLISGDDDGADGADEKDEAADVLPAGEAPATAETACKNKKKKQQQQQPRQELSDALETPSPIAERKRRPPPTLASQPSYRLEWSDAGSNYVLRAPNFELMSETERTEWIAWLDEERRAIETEEAQLRRKTIDLHRQVVAWMGTYIKA